MWNLRRAIPSRRARRPAEASRGAGFDPPRLFRRFFDLIERLERPQPPLETKSEPVRKVRITRLDEDAERKP
jgi:hypothetical protein